MIITRYLSQASLNLKKPLKLSYNKYNEIIHQTSPLVISHGLMGNRSNWHTIALKLAKLLNPPRNIYIPDARNHGTSPKDSEVGYDAMSEDLKLLINSEIHSDKVALMGHSMGGLTNVLFALKWPEMVEKLIIVDVNPALPHHKLLAHIVKIMELMRAYPISKNEKSITKERQKLYAYLKRGVPSQRTRQFLAKNLIRSNGNIKWQLNLSALIDNSGQFEIYPQMFRGKTYSGPSFVIYGGESQFVTQKDFPEIKKLLPNVEFELIQDAGHWLHFEKPLEFIKIASEKLNKV